MLADGAPPCATCGAPFYRTAVMMLGDGKKQMQSLCREHTAEVRRVTLSTSNRMIAGTEFWDWKTTQRYARLAEAGHTIQHMGEVMQEVHGEKPGPRGSERVHRGHLEQGTKPHVETWGAMLKRKLIDDPEEQS